MSAHNNQHDQSPQINKKVYPNSETNNNSNANLLTTSIASTSGASSGNRIISSLQTAPSVNPAISNLLDSPVSRKRRPNLDSYLQEYPYYNNNNIAVTSSHNRTGSQIVQTQPPSGSQLSHIHPHSQQLHSHPHSHSQPTPLNHSISQPANQIHGYTSMNLNNGNNSSNHYSNYTNSQIPHVNYSQISSTTSALNHQLPLTNISKPNLGGIPSMEANRSSSLSYPTNLGHSTSQNIHGVPSYSINSSNSSTLLPSVHIPSNMHLSPSHNSNHNAPLGTSRGSIVSSSSSTSKHSSLSLGNQSLLSATPVMTSSSNMLGNSNSDSTPRKSTQKWTPEDDNLIIHYKETLNLSWKKISSLIHHRHTWQAIQMRYLRCLKDRNASWSTQQNETLLRVLKEDWEGRWRRVSVGLGPSFGGERCYRRVINLCELMASGSEDIPKDIARQLRESGIKFENGLVMEDSQGRGEIQERDHVRRVSESNAENEQSQSHDSEESEDHHNGRTPAELEEDLKLLKKFSREQIRLLIKYCGD